MSQEEKDKIKEYQKKEVSRIGSVQKRSVQIVIFGKFKHSDEGFKYFIGYKRGEIVKP